MAVLNFADLKKGANDIAKLNEEASKLKSTKFERDERLWYPELDKNGEGSAVIRFLPAPQGESVPFVRKFSYGFKGPTGKWFIELSPETIGQPDPVREYTGSLWDSGVEEKKEEARKYKRRLGFVTNIYVVKHKARPSDEGKVFLYEFGKKIWEKLNDKMSPDDEDKKAVNPFDLWNGANFRLKVSNVSGFRNYDKSEFDEVSQLAPSDEEMERIWKMAYPLQPEISADKIKSYDELKSKLHSVLGLNGGGQTAPSRFQSDVGDGDDDGVPPFDVSGSKSSGEDDLEWLRNLAKGE